MEPDYLLFTRMVISLKERNIGINMKSFFPEDLKIVVNVTLPGQRTQTHELAMTPELLNSSPAETARAVGQYVEVKTLEQLEANIEMAKKLGIGKTQA